MEPDDIQRSIFPGKVALRRAVVETAAGSAAAPWESIELKIVRVLEAMTAHAQSGDGFAGAAKRGRKAGGGAGNRHGVAAWKASC